MRMKVSSSNNASYSLFVDLQLKAHKSGQAQKATCLHEKFAGVAEQVGPVSKAELKQAYARKAVGPGTRFWAAGMAQPQALWSVRELRWHVMRRPGVNLLYYFLYRTVTLVNGIVTPKA